MKKSTLDSPFDLLYEENVPLGEDGELSSELVSLFVEVFREELLEKCGHLFEGLDGQAS